MCDQTPVTYSDGDIVWVKIGSVWWPGTVKDVEKDGSANALLGGLRNKPIAVVKFFDEDTYEFVKNLENIYHYNCRRKDEFIRKGLEKYRRGTAHMRKFPEDIRKAQRLVCEDEDIINSPAFAPAAKVDYNEVFGTTPKKKVKKDDLSLRTKFLPFKKRPTAPPAFNYKGRNNCPFCEFSIDSLDVLMVHIRYNHTSDRVDYSIPYGKNSIPVMEAKAAQPTKLVRVRKKNTPTQVEKKPAVAETVTKVRNQVGTKRRTIATPRKRQPEKEEEEEKEETEKPPEPKTPAATAATKPEKPTEKKKRYTDVLLADWSEDDQTRDTDREEDKAEEEEAVDKVDKTKTDVDESSNVAETAKEAEKEKDEAAKVVESETKPVAEVAKKETPSCFDFDEEDDGFIGMSNANTYGRKIPRVIPVQDKTELGMDPEIEELFKRKPESEKEEEAPPPKRKRGRPPKNSKPQGVDPPKASPKQSEETLASTRERRPGALKSYIGEVIEKIPNPDDVDDEPQKPPSRRKQDLKRQSLKELDEVEAILATRRRTEKSDTEYLPPAHIIRQTPKRRDPELEAQRKRLSDFDNIESKTEELLASTPRVDVNDECLDATVEYLEDEPEPEPEPEPVRSLSAKIPLKKWQEDIRVAMDSDTPVKKSAIPQWKQGIQEAMKATKDSQQIKKFVFGAKNLEPGTSNVVKVSKLTNKGNNTLVIVPESRKIINKQQQVVLLSKQAATSKPIVVTSKPSVAKVATQPFLKVISDGNGGTKKVVSQKVVQIGSKTSPSTFVLSGGKHIVRGFNGSGKTFILGGSTGQTVYRRLKKIQATPGVSGGKPAQCVFKTVKSPTQPFKTVRLVSSDKTSTTPQRQFIIRTPEQQSIKVSQPDPTPQVVQVPQAQTLPIGTQQMVSMQSQEGQTTYMLVTVDSSGNVQQLDPAVLSYESDVTPQLYESATDVLTPSYPSAGQDILAEALANTNVLESEMPLTSLIMPAMDGQGALTDNSGLLTTPLVQETSVTLQKPIMSPVEVPTSIVPDTSGLQPPPLPPTPTAEDVLLEETDGGDGLMIAEHEQQHMEDEGIEAQNAGEDFFTDEAQEGEGNTFQSMPLLTEDATPSDETVEQTEMTQTEQQVTNDYLGDVTAMGQQVSQEELGKFGINALPEGSSEIYHTSDGQQFIYMKHPMQVATSGVATKQGQ